VRRHKKSVGAGIKVLREDAEEVRVVRQKR
jgi:hypothetical protein